MANILFFAQLKEQLGIDQLSLEITPTGMTVKAIKQQLCEQHPEWQTHLNQANVLAAVNQQMVKDEHQVFEQDELAFFPPVTGG